jgi:hypothetical protein
LPINAAHFRLTDASRVHSKPQEQRTSIFGARLTVRNHAKIFLLCHNENSYGKVNLATWRDLKAKVLSESFSRTKLALL